jgi:hypothetical protein
MSTVTFDKLAYLETLKAAGVPEPQARAHAQALDEALRDTVATRSDLRAELEPVKLEIADQKGELRLLKWMVGFNLALSATIIVKPFAG